MKKPYFGSNATESDEKNGQNQEYNITGFNALLVPLIRSKIRRKNFGPGSGQQTILTMQMSPGPEDQEINSLDRSLAPENNVDPPTWEIVENTTPEDSVEDALKRKIPSTEKIMRSTR